MHTCSFQHRTSRVIAVAAVAALLALCGSSTSVAAVTSSASYLAPQQLSATQSKPKPKPKRHTVSGPLAGTWSGQYSGAFAGTFTLHWTQSGSSLSGSIKLSNPSGVYAIKGTVRGSSIAFGALAAGATYTGSVSGKSMAGHYNSPKGPGSWSAHKTS